MKLRKLKLAESLKVAHAVLRHIRVPSAVVDNGALYGYENGREHGLAFVQYLGFKKRSYRHTICWAQARSSDQIVVYMSERGEEFEVDTSVPTERAYKDARYFGADRVENAAAFISHELEKLAVLDALETAGKTSSTGKSKK